MKYLQSSVLILNRTSTAPTKKKVVETCVETKFLWLKVPFLLRGITKYFLQILSFYFLSVYRVLLIRWHEIILVLNFTPRMTFSKIEMMCQGAKYSIQYPLKSLYSGSREVKMISLATHPSKNLLPVIVICSRAAEFETIFAVVWETFVVSEWLTQKAPREKLS